jgi:S-adenosylmethionine hydrolase
MIVLCTDFGLQGPYIGQVKALLYRAAPGVAIIDLFSDLVPFEPQLAAYLLPAYVDEFPQASVFLCVVDPGVGSGRGAVVVEADGQWFVGPDNGLFGMIAKRANNARLWNITWRPGKLSSSFHGRDLFAPVAAMLANSQEVPGDEIDWHGLTGTDWPDELYKIVYIDRFGNAMTGVRTSAVAANTQFVVAEQSVHRARTFSDVPVGQPFWYENANGLVEIAVNQGRADETLGLVTGMSVHQAPD